ncbi:MAG: hypothetical protein K6D90_04355 [Lachnospiraceae bacterium]|nr:hypothetical protein [Lachnospiraceae bacterium]
MVAAGRSAVDKRNLKNFIVLIIVALLIVAAFLLIANRGSKRDESPLARTAVEEVLDRDLSRNYPATPKEVVKFYSEITRCFYGEEYTEDQLVALADQSRMLFDDELRANQTDEQYLMNLRTVIENYKEEKRSISSFSVASASDVDYHDFKGDRWARLIAIYTIKTNHTFNTSKEEYLLRKDAQGHWKIFGWRVIEEAAIE